MSFVYWHILGIKEGKQNIMKVNTSKIFLVDDNAFHLELVAKVLNDEGFSDITTFSNGFDALENLHQNPDIIFLDHDMDNINGFDTLRKIKRQNPDIFVVMVSGQEDISTAVESLKFGAIDYIQKNEAMAEKIVEVIAKVDNLKAMLKRRKPSILKSLFTFL